MIDDPELVADFITESREHLADVEGQLLEIEAGGANVDVDLVNTVFRGVHSIKGAAGFLGLSTVNRLAHSLENVLGKMRTRELAPTPQIVDVMLKAADSLTKLINDVQNSNGADVSSHTTELDRIFAEEGATPSELGASAAIAACVVATAAAVESADVKAQVVEPAAEPVTKSATEGHPSPAPAEAAAESRAPQNAEPGKTAPAASAAVENSIRVHVGVLDSLMNLAGELVLGRNQLMQTINADGHAGIEAVAARLDQVTTELQEAIMRTRMQPIGAVFSKFPRVVRDLSAKLGKQCDVLMEGKEVEVDKTILEAIGDPLTHLVRNSIDHGVERPEVRVAAGKAAGGTVRLRAYHQAGKVRIDVADDGGGINPSKLKQKAIEKGVITAEQGARMGDREATRLIFHPGFSTAEKVTDVSGRGVGMDVVRTNIEKLGGTVDIDSTPGSGTTIQIMLPLTLAIIPSLIIRSGDECFAVPQVNVLELVRLRTKDSQANIAKVKDAEVLRLRGELLPLVRLDEIFGLATRGNQPSDGPISVIVIETGPRRYGLVVDEIVDSEEIVVKPLGRHVKSCNCLAGATILGDGHVALILDAAGIAARAEFADQQSHDAADGATRPNEATGKDLQDLLIFSTVPGERFAFPMSLVTRLERVQAEDIHIIGGRRLLQYRGSSLPLLRLEDHIKTPPMEELDRYFVIVFRAAKRETGLLVPYLDDIRQLAPEIDAQTFRERGVAGAFVLNGATMRLIEILDLAELAYPEWFAESEQEKQEAAVGETPLVLIAEDSAFFRKQVGDFLTSKGFRVVSCEDGARAWEFLTGEPHDVKLVVTDIEMPHLNGFELCRKIKAHPEHGSLPVIALTSLASEADVERGREAGIDDYQVKMDRERLMEAVTKLLPRSKARLAPPRSPAARDERTPCLSA